MTARTTHIARFAAEMADKGFDVNAEGLTVTVTRTMTADAFAIVRFTDGTNPAESDVEVRTHSTGAATKGAASERHREVVPITAGIAILATVIASRITLVEAEDELARLGF